MPHPHPALLLTTALTAWPAFADGAAVQVTCPDAPAAYCEALITELGQHLPQARIGTDPAPARLKLDITERSATRIAGRLTLAGPGRPEITTGEGTVMLMDGAPETLAPRQLAVVLVALALPDLTRALAAPR